MDGHELVNKKAAYGVYDREVLTEEQLLDVIQKRLLYFKIDMPDSDLSKVTIRHKMVKGYIQEKDTDFGGIVYVNDNITEGEPKGIYQPMSMLKDCIRSMGVMYFDKGNLMLYCTEIDSAALEYCLKYAKEQVKSMLNIKATNFETAAMKLRNAEIVSLKVD